MKQTKKILKTVLGVCEEDLELFFKAIELQETIVNFELENLKMKQFDQKYSVELEKLKKLRDQLIELAKRKAG